MESQRASGSARAISRLASEQVLIKITATTENLLLAEHLKSEGISCAITALTSPSQIYLATLVKAAYAAIHVSRLTKQLGDGIAILRDCVAVARKSPSRVLAASRKSVDQVLATIMTEASDITLPLELIFKLGEYDLSLKAIEEFANQRITRYASPYHIGLM